MKIKVTKYYPNFFEIDEDQKQVDIVSVDNKEIKFWGGSHADLCIMQNVDYLKDKIGKLHFVHNCMNYTLIIYDDLPIAWVEIIEL